MLTLSTIRRRIGGAAAARPLALLKVDIEGFEWLEMQQNTSRAATAIGTVLEKEPALAHLMAEISAAPPQFEQLCIELHHGTPRAWQLAIRRMLELGFTLAAVEGARLQPWDLWDQLSFGRALADFSAGPPSSAVTPRVARLIAATPSLSDFLGRHCGGSAAADVDSLFAKVASL